MKDIQVIKRNGQKEILDIDKIHFVVEEACKGLSGVSASQVEMNANLQFSDGITTKEIQQILIRSAADLISLDNPNYQFAAAKLVLYSLRKEVFGKYEYFSLQELLDRNISEGVYDAEILEKYTPVEIKKISTFIKHERDEDFTYAGIQQLVDKYLVQDRTTHQIYETPQFAFILVAATLFADYPKETRLKYVKDYYDALSTFKLNLPTPVLAGVRTPKRQFASCVLTDVGDTLNSIFATNTSVGKYTANRAGIGINMGRIRGLGSKVRGGEVVHTGIIPFLQMYAKTLKSTTQNGVRGGSGTINFPFWHSEIENLIVLKNNKGTEDSRVRTVDYCISLSKLFYERVLSDGIITLFSPHEVPGLYDTFGTDKFDELYLKYEKDHKIKKQQISAVKFCLDLLKERLETGRIYLMNLDHCNEHSSFIDLIKMTNLCTEITLPVNPIENEYEQDPGEIALCILTSVNVGLLRDLSELESLCDLSVRALDELIDYQDYPINAALSTKKRRSLGVGFTGLAHFIAKHNVKYDDIEAAKLVHELAESFQYYLIKSSVQLAKEKGPCEWYQKTKYGQGLLPIDHYKHEIDQALSFPSLKQDWEELRKDLIAYGIRNSTLSAQAPVESSSVVTNSTNGIEPPRELLSIKKSKKTILKQIVPQYSSLKKNYTLLWDMKDNKGYFCIVGAMQKFFDQSISANWNYNPLKFEENAIPLELLLEDMLLAYRLGHKTAYYCTTFDDKKEEDVEFNVKGAVIDSKIDALNDDGECEACKL